MGGGYYSPDLFRVTFGRVLLKTLLYKSVYVLVLTFIRSLMKNIWAKIWLRPYFLSICLSAQMLSETQVEKAKILKLS